MSDIALATLILAAAILIQAITSVVGPVLQFIQLRKNQPTPKPNKKTETSFLRGVIRFGWFPLLITIGAGIVLTLILRSSAPLNRNAVFQISMLVAIIVSVPFTVILSYSLRQLTQAFKEISSINLDMHKDTNEYLSTVVNALTESFTKESAQWKQFTAALKPAQKKRTRD